MTKRESGFYWVSAHGLEFEPAKVEYQGDEPIAIWFAGSDFRMDPYQCEIGEIIVKPDSLQ